MYSLIHAWNVLVNTRLVTLTGPGGIGKTRLALTVAEKVAENFKDGIYFVSLAPIRVVEDIVQAIAEAVNFPVATPEQPLTQLLRFLANRQLLLVMDNYEHLLEGVYIASEILQSAPGVKIIATSQEKLNLHSETDAVSLFTQSAKKVNPQYKPSENQLEQIAKICKTLQGMPLAIEMAASWLQVISEEEIADELDKGIDILETEARDVPGRHRSVRTVFDHSWTLLNREEQELFVLLSVFRGGFTRQACQDVAGASLKQLAGLVNKSFISHNHTSGRYEIHELLRQYAQDKLESTPEASQSAHEAHAAYFANFMSSAWPQLRSNNQLSALKEIEADIANVRTAWDYRVSQAHAEQIRKFMYSFWFIYLAQGWNHAAVELFGGAVDALSDHTDDAESEQGYALSLESSKILEDLDRDLDLAKVLDGLSLNSYYLAHLEDEEYAMRTINKIAVEYHDDTLLAYSLFLWSLIDLRKKKFSEGKDHANASLKLFEGLGDIFSSSWPLLSLGGLSMADQEFQEAGRYYRKCLRISENFKYQWLMENASKYLGKIALSINEIEEAEYYLNKSLVIAQETGLGREKANLLYEIAALRVAQNRIEEAVGLLALALTLPQSSLARIEGGSIQEKCLILLTRIENAISQDAYSAAVKNGQESVLDEVILELTRENGDLYLYPSPSA